MEKLTLSITDLYKLGLSDAIIADALFFYAQFLRSATSGKTPISNFSVEIDENTRKKLLLNFDEGRHFEAVMATIGFRKDGDYYVLDYQCNSNYLNACTEIIESNLENVLKRLPDDQRWRIERANNAISGSSARPPARDAKALSDRNRKDLEEVREAQRLKYLERKGLPSSYKAQPQLQRAVKEQANLPELKGNSTRPVAKQISNIFSLKKNNAGRR